MAITACAITACADGTNATTYTTIAYAPTASRLQVVAVTNDQAASQLLLAPSITGHGLTYVQAASQEVIGGGQAAQLSIMLYRAMGDSPASGTLSFAWPGASPAAGISWSIVEFAGVDTGGSAGEDAIRQVVTASLATAGNSVTINLEDFGGACNAAYGAFLHSKAQVKSPGTGFTELHDVNHSAPTEGLETEWADGTSASVGASWSGAAASAGGIAVELKAQFVEPPFEAMSGIIRGDI